MAVYKAIDGKALNYHAGLRNCLQYVFQPGKTDTETLCFVIGPCPDGPIDFNAVYGSFLDIKNEWGKDSGRMYKHFCLSFAKTDNISPTEALELGIKFGERTYDGFQTAMAIHTDKDHIHCHYVVNTVSYLDGRKFQKSRKDLKADKEYCNELCREYGLSVAQKGKHADGSDMDEGDITAWNKDKYRALIRNDKPSYLCDCAVAIAKAKGTATTKEEFITAMSAQGWAVQWSDSRKHITYINTDGKKVRDSNIEKTFNISATKEVLLDEFIGKARNSGRAENVVGKGQPFAEGRELAPETRKPKPQRRGRGSSR